MAAARPGLGRDARPRCATSRSSPSTRSSAGTRLPEPMLAAAGRRRPPGPVRLRPRPARRPEPDLLAFVISGAAAWVARGARRHRGGDARPGARRAAPAPAPDRSRSLRTIDREARDLRAARRGSTRPPTAVAPGPARGRRLRRRPLPRHARRRGAQRHRARGTRRCFRRRRLVERSAHAKDRRPDHHHPGAGARLRPARPAGLAPGAGVAEGRSASRAACIRRPRTASSTT